MSNLYNILAELCAKKGVTAYRMCKDCNIQPSIVTDLKKGRRQSIKIETAAKIADYFHVSTDYLLGKEEPTAAPLPDLTAKDERDIAKKLSETLDTLENADDGLMFDGEPLDDETRELLRASLQNQLEMTKRLAKQKFTPKKYRK